MAAWLPIAVSWALAGVFATALDHKLGEPARFRASLAAYRLVPERFAAAASVVVMVLEALAVCALLLGTPLGLLLAMLTLAVYAFAMAINVLRGRHHIDCGCGDAPTPVSWLTVTRNLCLVALALSALTMPTPGPALDIWGVLFCAASATTAFGLYHCIEELLANRSRHQRLWLGVST